MTIWRQRAIIRFAVFDRDGGRCAYCKRSVTFDPEVTRRDTSIRPGTMDHLRPRSKGGGYTIDNLVLACGTCNNARGVLPHKSFKLWRAKNPIRSSESRTEFRRMRSAGLYGNGPTRRARSLEEYQKIGSYLKLRKRRKKAPPTPESRPCDSKDGGEKRC